MRQIETDIVLAGEDIHLNFGGIKALTAVDFQVKKGRRNGERMATAILEREKES